MIAGGKHVGAELEEVIGDPRGDTESAGGVLRVDDGEVDRVSLADVANVLRDDFASRAAEDVADEKNVQGREFLLRLSASSGVRQMTSRTQINARISP